jgi:hypothetical protein
VTYIYKPQDPKEGFAHVVVHKSAKPGVPTVEKPSSNTCKDAVIRCDKPPLEFP